MGASLDGNILHLDQVTNKQQCSRELPSLDKEVVVLKEFMGQRLHQIVCLLCLQFYLVEGELVGVQPKPMPLDWEALGVVGDMLVGCKAVSALVVLNSLAPC